MHASLFSRSSWRWAAVAMVIAVVMTVVPLATRADALPAGFQDDVVLDGLSNPTKVLFSPDGRVFIAEKSGLVKVFDDLDDPTPDVFADLRTQVHNFWDRGLLGMALHPNFPSDPRVYVLYAHDAEPGGTAPRWGVVDGTSDPCPNPPGATGDGCVITGRLSVLTASGNTSTGEDVLIEDFCQQYPSHSVGDLGFGADGALYVSAGDGASFTFADYGQKGDPVNPCGDPPGGVGGPMTSPTAEGGALRSQDVRTPGDPTGLNGTVLRVNPDTGAALPDNPLFGDPDPNTARIVAQGLRNPFRFDVRPGTSEVWLGDVGWNKFEEINRVDNPTGAVENFGWPCYEGDSKPGTYKDLALCTSLYDAGASAHSQPWFSYSHGSNFVPGDGCGSGGSSAAGVAFYESGPYPDSYDGAVFYADYTRDCIWVLPTGGGDLPDPALRTPFVAPADNPVDLEIGPDGNLYYINYLDGKIHRISYFSGNTPPTASLTADPEEGPAPLEVTFDATGSTDPESGDLTYAWDLDDDGEFDDGTTATITWTYDEPGDHTATVRVTDPGGLSDDAEFTVSADNTKPSVTIDTPATGFTWDVGDEIAFSASATDAQDGTVTDLSWDILLHHCETLNDCHVHTIRSVDGPSGTEPAPDHDYPAYLELVVTATDSGGLTDTASLELDPNTIDLTVATDPTGLTVGLGTESELAPLTNEVIVGSSNSVSAPSPQTVDGTTYEFDSWSDGGGASHLVTAPATDQTLTATYVEVPPPSGFDARDIGNPALAGSTVDEGGGAVTVSGAGKDIWNSSDQFRYASQELTGDGSITARVVSQTTTHSWAKAGVMIRDGFAANARHAMIVQTPGNGVSFQRRLVAGDRSYSTKLAGPTPPQWVKLVRVGDEFTGYTSDDTITWTQVGSATVPMGATVRIGLAVTSHNSSAISTAEFDNVVIGAAEPPPPPPPVECDPSEWTAEYFANRTLSGDPVSQRCEGAIDNSWGSGGPGGAVPNDNFSARWTRTVDFDAGEYEVTARADDGVRVWVDDDQIIDEWQDQSATTYTATRTLSGTHVVKMEYYEHWGSAVAELDWALVNPPPPPPAEEFEPVGSDIGSPGVAGSTTSSGDAFTVVGGGSDIWKSSDRFHYAAQMLSGDGTLTAQVTSQTNSNEWAKAGVMIRESLSASSPHAMTVVTPSKGTAFQRRPSQGELSLHTAGPSWAAPAWVRIARSGDTFTGSVSQDGVTWTEVGSTTLTMANDVYVGLAVTSHNNATSSTATFTDVSLDTN